MRILLDAHLVEKKITGIGRYLIELISALLEYDQSNEYCILFRDDLDKDHTFRKLKSDNVTWIPTRLRGLTLRQNIEIRSLLKRYTPDVYHHPHFDLPIGISVPSVVTIHDVKYIRNPDFFPEMSFLKQLYMRWMFKQSVSRADYVITPSNSTSRDIQMLFGTPHEKIAVVYHGYTEYTNTSSVTEADLKNQFKIDAEFFLFVGERRPHKNLVNLIRAYKIIKNQLQNCPKLVIIGKKYSNYIDPENTIAELELTNDIIIADFVSDTFLTLFYKCANILILPSYYEGFGLPIIEAMNYELPVIVANNTSMPEIAGNAALLVDENDPRDIAAKVINLMSDSGLKNDLIALGKTNVKRFSWRQAAEKTLDIYLKVHKEKL